MFHPNTWQPRATFLLLITAIIAPLFVQQAHAQPDPDAVANKQAQADEQPIRSMVYLKYAEANATREAILALMAKQSELTLVADQRTNALVLRGTKDTVDEVLELIKSMDVAEIPRNAVAVLPDASEKSQDIVQVLRALKIDSVDIAAGPDGVLILKGQKEAVESVQNLIRIIEQQTQQQQQRPAAPKEVAVQLLWLSEAETPNASKLDKAFAEQLTSRGFRPLSVISELQVTVSGQSKATASGSAINGNFSTQMLLQTTDNQISLEIEVDAEYLSDDKESGLIHFATKLTSPINRWVVLGVAQRRVPETIPGDAPRELFVIRVREPTSFSQ
ncbi:MAG: hypothetical protein HKN47_27525 [Pirellulaceae bacterium]|nr:hypothetical protein [Pirellulaceae bacterium]